MILNQEAFKLDKEIRRVISRISEYENGERWGGHLNEKTNKEDIKRFEQLCKRWDIKYNEEFEKCVNDWGKCKEELIKYIEVKKKKR